MGISVKIIDDCMALVVDEKNFFSNEEERTFTVPISVLSDHKLNEFPQDCFIEICEFADDNSVVLHNAPTTISLNCDGIYTITFNELETRKYWDSPVGLKLYMETKRDIINERSEEIGDTFVDDYDDGVYINITYSLRVSPASVCTFAELFIIIDQFFHEIEGATDIALGSPFEKLENCKKESDFTMKILLPLFRKLGFTNVKYNHGNAEYGKDITFAKRTEFDEYEFWGVQVKYGDVSGGATGDINELISQTKDAFSMPFYDVYTRQTVRISKLIIAISGRFTKNAVAKIVDGITDYPLKNNIVFVDGEKISTLMERYRRF